MGTETRIGIVAGLLIVVVASVYFFYGSRAKEDEILIAAMPKPGAAIKIPASSDKKPAAQPAPASARPAPVTHAPPARKIQPPVVFRPTTPPVDVGTLVGPPADQLAMRTGIDKYRLTVPYAPPADALSPTPTPLRSGPSIALVEATRDNLKAAETPAPPSAATPSSTTPAKSSVLSDTPPSRVTIQPDAITARPAASPIANPADAWPRTHVAVKGDTIAGLAKLYYQDSKKAPEIVAANPKLKGRKNLRPGEVVTIPAPAKAAAAESADSLAAAKTYTVEEGDTFYAIANKTLGEARRWQEIFKLNKELLHGDPRKLRPGMVLRLPG